MRPLARRPRRTSPSSAALRVTTSEIGTANGATCLADSQVLTSHPSGGAGSPPHLGARCTQCHDVHRTDKPFGIDFASDPALASKLAAQQGCYHCHDTAPPRGDKRARALPETRTPAATPRARPAAWRRRIHF